MATPEKQVWWVAHHDLVSSNTTYDFGNGAKLIVFTAIGKAVKAYNGEPVESIDIAEMTALEFQNLLIGMAQIVLNN